MNAYNAKSAWYWKYFNTYNNESTEYIDINYIFYKQKGITFYKCKTNNDDINIINENSNKINHDNLKYINNDGTINLPITYDILKSILLN